MDMILDGLIDKTWEHFTNNREKIITKADINTDTKGYAQYSNDWLLVPEKSIPILWFGDLNRYFNSPVKIVTAALNPSNMEFKQDSNSSYSFCRFPKGEDIYTKNLLVEEDKLKYIDTLNSYFKISPYMSWFKSFEKILNYINSSYFSDNSVSNVAIHTDIFTPLATVPTWGNIINSKIKQNLKVDGYGLWKDLIEYLNPDIIFVSINKQAFEKAFAIDAYRFKNEYRENGNSYIRKYIKDQRIIVAGLNFRGIPFGGMTDNFKKNSFEDMNLI